MRVLLLSYGFKLEEEALVQVVQRIAYLLIFLVMLLMASHMTGMANKAVQTIRRYMIIPSAWYTFSKLGIAIYNVVVSHKRQSLFWQTLRLVSFSDALASFLTLERVMLLSNQSDQRFSKDLLGGTTFLVCVLLLCMGIKLLKSSQRMSR